MNRCIRSLIGVMAFVFGSAFVLQQQLHAQEPKAATLRWYGQSFFQLETASGKRIVFDPHAIPEFGRHVVQADLILCTHLHTDHAQVGIVENYKSARVFNGLKEGKKGRPAEWNIVDEKVGPIRIRTVGLYHDSREGMERGKNAAWIVEADGLTYCHLGDLGHELTPAQVKAIGSVDVLLIPVGGIYTLNGELAKRVVAQLKPKRIVVPMHYAVPGYDELLTPEEFLDEQPNVKKLTTTNELSIPLEAKVDAPAIVLLGWKKEEAAVPKK